MKWMVREGLCFRTLSIAWRHLMRPPPMATPICRWTKVGGNATAVARKRYKPEKIVGRLRQVDVLVSLVPRVRTARNFSRVFSLYHLLFTPIFFLGMLQALAQELYGAPPHDIDARIEMLVKSYPDWISGRDGNFLIM